MSYSYVTVQLLNINTYTCLDLIKAEVSTIGGLHLLTKLSE